MRIQFQPFTEGLAPAVREFNRRIGAAGFTPFPESPVSSWLPKLDGRKVYEEYFLAVENRAVRGAYILKSLDFYLEGQPAPVAGFRLPVSEGVVNESYRLVGPQAVRDAVRRQALLYGTGLGGDEEPVTRLLRAMGWSVEAVPFYFKVLNGYRFAREIAALRKTRFRRLALDVAAFSGMAWLGAKLARAALAKNQPGSQALPVDLEDQFSGWADEVWEAARDQYSMIAARDSATLNALYPPGDSRFLRLKVREGSRCLGWAVVMDKRLANHARFGNLRSGLIVDCLALPRDAARVIRAASGVLERRGVDFLRSHQYHGAWASALREAGFLSGPSYFLLAMSKALAERLDRIDPGRTRLHINRGDGDGPLYL